MTTEENMPLTRLGKIAEGVEKAVKVLHRIAEDPYKVTAVETRARAAEARIHHYRDQQFQVQHEEQAAKAEAATPSGAPHSDGSELLRAIFAIAGVFNVLHGRPSTDTNAIGALKARVDAIFRTIETGVRDSTPIGDSGEHVHRIVPINEVVRKLTARVSALEAAAAKQGVPVPPVTAVTPAGAVPSGAVTPLAPPPVHAPPPGTPVD